MSELDWKKRPRCSHALSMLINCHIHSSYAIAGYVWRVNVVNWRETQFYSGVMKANGSIKKILLILSEMWSFGIDLRSRKSQRYLFELAFLICPGA
jgi:hypothetical protein